ncbi:MAG: hypothetical protein H6807_02040 [Planctomycetes bacterium]|nr:hypothetical protein [Planctomycetota bacterium]
MIITRKAMILALVLLATSTVATVTAQVGYHVDKQRGFKIKTPGDWECIPIDINEKWIVAKFLCDRSFVARSGDFPVDHRPMMRVIVFPDSTRDEKKVELGDAGGVIVALFGKNPYKDYADFLRQTRSGFYFSKEDRGKIGKLDYQDLEVTFDKDAAKYRLVTWVFRTQDADFAVEFEILDDHFDKLAPIARKALKSFRFITREGGLASGTTDSGGIKKLDDEDLALMGDRKKWKAMHAADRRRIRKEAEDRAVQRYLDQLPDDWEVLDNDNCLVISHADPRYTAEVVKAVNCCRRWLDETFGEISDEYVMKTIVRVCKDYAEFRAYSMGGGGSIRISSSAEIDEIVIYKDTGEGTRGGFGSIFQSMGARYLHDKDRLIAWNLPNWFDSGLRNALANARPKGSKLEFAPDVYTIREVKIAEAKKELFSARELMTMDTGNLNDRYGVFFGESTLLVRYILDGARGCRPLKDFTTRYLRYVLEAAEEIDGRLPESRPAGEWKEPDTEKEEEEQYRKRRTATAGRDDELGKMVLEKLGFDDKDWAQIEKGLQRAID